MAAPPTLASNAPRTRRVTRDGGSPVDAPPVMPGTGLAATVSLLMGSSPTVQKSSVTESVMLQRTSSELGIRRYVS